MVPIAPRTRRLPSPTVSSTRAGGAARRPTSRSASHLERAGVSMTQADAMTGAALVLFSGGQDSTTCVAWALDRFERVETVGFDYGHRHRIELECRAPLRASLAAIKPEWATRLGDDHTVALA